jgi:hypothetical protein
MADAAPQIPENIRRVLAVGDPEVSNILLDAFFRGWSYRQFAEAMTKTRAYREEPELRELLEEYLRDE